MKIFKTAESRFEMGIIDSTLLIKIYGSFDTDMAEEFKDKLESYLPHSSEFSSIKVDMGECSLLSSPGLGALMYLWEFFKNKKLVLCNYTKEHETLFKISKLEKFFNLKERA